MNDRTITNSATFHSEPLTSAEKSWFWAAGAADRQPCAPAGQRHVAQAVDERVGLVGSPAPWPARP